MGTQQNFSTGYDSSYYTTIESQKPAIEKFLDDELGEIEHGPEDFFNGLVDGTATSFASTVRPLTAKDMENARNSLIDIEGYY